MKDPSLREIVSPPYGRMAAIYDFVMRHVDYKAWADYIETVFAHHGANPVSVLDLACGTGNMTLELSRRGYQMTGIDHSEEMLAIARKKAKEARRDIPFFKANLNGVEGPMPADTVICIYDSMNYLMSNDEVVQVLGQVRPFVRKKGLFLFDICTEANSVRHFRNITEREAGEGFAYVRHSFYQDGVQMNDFTINFKGANETIRETHRQRIYPVQELMDIVTGSDFLLLGAYDGFTLNTATEESDRVHFVLKPK